MKRNAKTRPAVSNGVGWTDDELAVLRAEYGLPNAPTAMQFAIRFGAHTPASIDGKALSIGLHRHPEYTRRARTAVREQERIKRAEARAAAMAPVVETKWPRFTRDQCMSRLDRLREMADPRYWIYPTAAAESSYIGTAANLLVTT